MSQETAAAYGSATDTRLEPWQGGLVGGIAGGLVFGVLMTLMMPEVLETQIPMMYGLEGGLVGWIAHMSHAAVLGVIFGALLALTPLGDRSVGVVTVAGVAYGLVVWATLAAVVMPIWVMGPEMGLTMVPNLEMGSLLGHVVYGLVLGVSAALLSR